VFTPAKSQEPAGAVISVTDGDLVIEGATFAWPSGPRDGLPRRLVQVERGNLTLANCRLFGPLAGDGGFEAIAFTGGAQKSKWPEKGSKPPGASTTASDDSAVHLDFHPAPHPRVNVCQLIDCYVGAEGRCLGMTGSQQVLRMYNSVAVTPGTLVAFDELDLAGPQSFEVGAVLKQNTLAASKTFFDVGEWLAQGLPSRPLLFETQDNLFCDPFDVAAGAAARTRSSVLLRYGGRTLQQGLLQWQSDSDGFSFDLHTFILRRDRNTGGRQKFEQDWTAVWGRDHVRDPVIDTGKSDKIRFKAAGQKKLKDFDRDKRLADLELQAQCEAATKASHGGSIGVDLKRLGI
jgi:hypothetical protein